MSTSHRGSNTFPDFFTIKGPIPTKVIPLQFGKKIYYQSTVLTENDNSEETEFKPRLKPYLDNDDEMVDCTDVEQNYDIILTKSGKFQTSFYVPSSLLPYIIGAKRARLNALQKNTNTIIKIPRINEKGDVIISGDSERKVASARTQITITMAQRKDKMPPTHFIAIPINSQSITENLLKFQKCVLEKPGRGVTKSLFQNVVKLHLTIVVLTLLDEEEVENAKKTLKTYYDEYISSVFSKNQKHKVTIQGLEIMNDDPSNVYVLYSKVQMQNPELLNKLQEMCNKISNQFCKAGLAKREFDKVKLHMTVMNTNFRESGEEKMSFDARDILDKHGDFYFGDFELRQLDLCIRGTTTNDKGEPKYYDTATTILI
ncbi:activating signal cointegrator 1 complex subunit 1-like [Euwallacea fornicatus]|uniref:activating signal cointegrator 1 complex subunit 1-like n=1 Tax=Euwallacea fornicatus TaxID=995702 RepID=UPI0033905955